MRARRPAARCGGRERGPSRRLPFRRHEKDRRPTPTIRRFQPRGSARRRPAPFHHGVDSAAGSRGTRRRVAEPCAHANGRSASEPAKPVTTVERDILEGPEAVPPPLIEHVAGAPPETRFGAKQPAHHRLITATLLPSSSKRANAYPGTGVPGPHDVPSTEIIEKKQRRRAGTQEHVRGCCTGARQEVISG